MYLRNAICLEFQVPTASNLGIYLGMPLFYGRMKKTDFTHVLVNAYKRLAGWKTQILSRVAKMILIKSTLATLANYSMQTVMLPHFIIQLLDKCCREFFWGSLDQQRRMHTVAWTEICKPKQYGGLGIPNLQDMNVALLAKLVWKLAQQKDGDLVNSVLSHKYGGWRTLVREEKKTNCSTTWRSIGKVPTWIKRNSKWEVGDGKTVLFWRDAWLGEMPLSQVA